MSINTMTMKEIKKGIAKLLPQPYGPLSIRSSYVWDSDSQSSLLAASNINAVQSSPVDNFMRVSIELPND